MVQSVCLLVDAAQHEQQHHDDARPVLACAAHRLLRVTQSLCTPGSSAWQCTGQPGFVRSADAQLLALATPTTARGTLADQEEEGLMHMCSQALRTAFAPCMQEAHVPACLHVSKHACSM